MRSVIIISYDLVLHFFMVWTMALCFLTVQCLVVYISVCFYLAIHVFEFPQAVIEGWKFSQNLYDIVPFGAAGCDCDSFHDHMLQFVPPSRQMDEERCHTGLDENWSIDRMIIIGHKISNRVAISRNCKCVAKMLQSQRNAWRICEKDVPMRDELMNSAVAEGNY